MKKTLYFILTIWLVLWLQVISNHFLGGSHFAILWGLLATLHFGLTRGPWVGESMGFAWGLLIDAASLGSLGLQAMLFAIVGYTAGSLRRQLDSSKLWTQTIFSGMVSVVYYVVYLLLSRFLSSGEEPVRWTFISISLLNACLAPVMFQCLRYWALAWDMAPPERD